MEQEMMFDHFHMKSPVRILAIITLFLMLSACGGADGETSFTTKKGTLSVPPLHNISVKEGQTAKMSVNASFTGYSTNLTYSWTCYSSGLEINLENSRSRTISFTAPAVSSDKVIICTVTVGVENGIVTSFSGGNTQRGIITILDIDPAIDAGNSKSGASGALISLDGVNLNTNVSTNNLQWRQISGPLVNIVASTQLRAEFMAPIVSIQTDLKFELKLINSQGVVVTDVVTITLLPPQPPTILVTYNASVNEEISAVIDASSSFDDSSIVSYQWQQISGAQVAMAGSTTDTLSFVTPTTSITLNLQFELTITDATNLTTSQIIDITVLPVNELPIIELTGPIEVNEQVQVVLDSSASYDPDGNVASFRWTQISGTEASLTGAETNTLEFSAPKTVDKQQLTFELLITDDLGGTATQRHIMHILPVNTAPVLTVTSPEVGFSKESIVFIYTATDFDGYVKSIDILQVSGSHVHIESHSNLASTLVLPIVNATETLKFKIIATDNESATAEKMVSIEVSRPANLTQIYFPINGGLVSGDSISIQGRSIENGNGVQADISISLDGVASLTTSDVNGYWRINEVNFSNNLLAAEIVVTTTYEGGGESSHKIEIVREKKWYGAATKKIVDCYHNKIFHIWAGNVVTTDCDGGSEVVIASETVSIGVDFISANDAVFDDLFSKLYVATDQGIISINSSGVGKYVHNSEDGSPLIADIIKGEYAPVDDGWPAEDRGWATAAVLFDRDAADGNFFVYTNLDSGIIKPLSALNNALSESNLQNIISDFLYDPRGSEILLITNSGEIEKVDMNSSAVTLDLVEGRGEIPSPLIAGSVTFHTIISRENNREYYDYRGIKVDHLIPESILPEHVDIKEFYVDRSDYYVVVNNASNSFIKVDGNYFSTSASILWELNTGHKREFGNISTSDYHVSSGEIFFTGNDEAFEFDLDTGFFNQITDNASFSIELLQEEIKYNPKNDSLFLYDHRMNSLSEIDVATGGDLLAPVGFNIVDLKIGSLMLNGDSSKLFIQADYLGGDNIAQDYGFYSLGLPTQSVDGLLEISEDYTLGFGPIINSIDISTEACFLDELGGNIVSYNYLDKAVSTLVNLASYPALGSLARPMACADNGTTIYVQQAATNDLYKIDTVAATSTEVSSSIRGLGIQLGDADKIYYDGDRKILIQVESSKIIVIDIEGGDRALLYSN